MPRNRNTGTGPAHAIVTLTGQGAHGAAEGGHLLAESGREAVAGFVLFVEEALLELALFTDLHFSDLEAEVEFVAEPLLFHECFEIEQDLFSLLGVGDFAEVFAAWEAEGKDVEGVGVRVAVCVGFGVEDVCWK